MPIVVEIEHTTITLECFLSVYLVMNGVSRVRAVHGKHLCGASGRGQEHHLLSQCHHGSHDGRSQRGLPSACATPQNHHRMGGVIHHETGKGAQSVGLFGCRFQRELSFDLEDKFVCEHVFRKR